MAAALLCLGSSNLVVRPSCVRAQNDTPPSIGPSSVEQVEFGMVLQAEGGSFKNVFGTVTVPADWPGQQRVRAVKEDLPPGAAVSYRMIDDVGRQMTVKIPSLPAGREVRAVVTFEVQRLPPVASKQAGPFKAAERAAMGRKVAMHLQPSPKIESDDSRVRQAAQQAAGRSDNAWDKVQAIHQWVHKNIQFAGGLENVQTCMQTLELHRGVCAEMNSLAVAMLRASGFPARLVRVPGHCYYEVFLLDDEGQAHWLAGDASRDAAIAADGVLPGLILQKGDNVNIVDPATKRRSKGRFLTETVLGVPQNKAARLRFQPVTPAVPSTAKREDR